MALTFAEVSKAEYILLTAFTRDGRPKPTAQQMLHTVDPLTAILAIGHAVARSGRCGGSVAVFDGRRRYDLVLTDDGSERLEASSGNAYAGEVRRCLVAAVKIAGFSFDQDYSPHTSNGRVWLAAPLPTPRNSVVRSIGTVST